MIGWWTRFQGAIPVVPHVHAKIVAETEDWGRLSKSWDAARAGGRFPVAVEKHLSERYSK